MLSSLSIDFPDFGPPARHITSTDDDPEQQVDIFIDSKGACVIPDEG
jgi:hypothetical protein